MLRRGFARFLLGDYPVRTSMEVCYSRIHGQEYIEPAYTSTMTLILAKVCDDGVIIAGDSKSSHPDTEPIDDIQKVFDVGGVAVAIAGKEVETLLPLAIAGTAQLLVKTKTQMTIEQLAHLLREHAKVFLVLPKTEIGLFVADGKSLYAIKVSATEDKIERVTDAEMGIDNTVYPPDISETTTKAWEKQFRKTLKLNEGETVGGKTEVVIIERVRRSYD